MLVVFSVFWVGLIEPSCWTTSFDASIFTQVESKLPLTTRKSDPLQKRIHFLIKDLDAYGAGAEAEKAISELLKIQKENPNAIAGPQISYKVREERGRKIGRALGNSHMGDAALSRRDDPEYKFALRYKDAMELASLIEDQTGQRVWYFAIEEAIHGNSRPHALHVLELVKSSSGRGIEFVRRAMDEFIISYRDPSISDEKHFLPFGQTNFEIFHGLLLKHGNEGDVDRLRLYASIQSARKNQREADRAMLDALLIQHRLWSTEMKDRLKARDLSGSLKELRYLDQQIKAGKYQALEEDAQFDPEGIFLEALINLQLAFSYQSVQEFEDDVIDSIDKSKDHIGLKIEFLALQEILKRKANEEGNVRALNVIDAFEGGKIKRDRSAIDWSKDVGRKLRMLRELRGMTHPESNN